MSINTITWNAYVPVLQNQDQYGDFWCRTFTETRTAGNQAALDKENIYKRIKPNLREVNNILH